MRMKSTLGFLACRTPSQEEGGEEEDGFHEGQGSVQAVEGIVEEGLRTPGKPFPDRADNIHPSQLGSLGVIEFGHDGLLRERTFSAKGAVTRNSSSPDWEARVSAQKQAR